MLFPLASSHLGMLWKGKIEYARVWKGKTEYAKVGKARSSMLRYGKTRESKVLEGTVFQFIILLLLLTA